MKNIVKYIIVIASVAIIANGCKEDFLELENPNQTTSDMFLENTGNLSLQLTSVYSSVKTYRLYGSGFLASVLYPKSFTSDQNWTGNPDWNHMYQHESISSDGILSDTWVGWYRVVSRANDFLDMAAQYIDVNSPEGDELTEVNQMIGQAKFLRAFAYFHLVRLYGEGNPAIDGSKAGVPLILEVAGTIDEMMVGRASVNEVYTQIIKDLEDAVDVLPATWDEDNIARADSWSAKGLLSRVYMTQHDYTSAKSALNDIITNGGFSLVPMDEYSGLFHGDNEFSEESLFEINFTVDMTVNGFNGGLGSNHALLTSPPGKGWNNIFPHDESIRRFGSDPRLHVCALEPGVDVVDGDTVGYNSTELGWSYRKYADDVTSVTKTNRNYGANFHIVRLADVYLMYAEVLNEEGDDATASEYMNKVRRRAYGFDPNTPEASVDYTGLTGTQLRDSIREERFRELFGEGMRWYDVKRWQIGAEEAARYQRVVSGVINFDDIDYYLPIPQTELDNNDAIEQSTGYK